MVDSFFVNSVYLWPLRWLVVAGGVPVLAKYSKPVRGYEGVGYVIRDDAL